jgi:hypothetical protein
LYYLLSTLLQSIATSGEKRGKDSLLGEWDNTISAREMSNWAVRRVGLGSMKVVLVGDRAEMLAEVVVVIVEGLPRENIVAAVENVVIVTNGLVVVIGAVVEVGLIMAVAINSIVVVVWVSTTGWCSIVYFSIVWFLK